MVIYIQFELKGFSKRSSNIIFELLLFFFKGGAPSFTKRVDFNKDFIKKYVAYKQTVTNIVILYLLGLIILVDYLQKTSQK